MHQVCIWDFPSKKSKNAIYKECDRYATFNGDYNSGLAGSGMRFNDTILKNREEAERWIKLNDSGWYDNLAIRYKDGRKINWLVKFEFHC